LARGSVGVGAPVSGGGRRARHSGLVGGDLSGGEAARKEIREVQWLVVELGWWQPRGEVRGSAVS